jgi:hypothetical protein
MTAAISMNLVELTVNLSHVIVNEPEVLHTKCSLKCVREGKKLFLGA